MTKTTNMENNEELLSQNDVKEEIVKYGKEAMRIEEEREKLIYEQSGAIIATLSILIVALITGIFELIDVLPQKITLLLVVFSCILMCLLLSSLSFALIAQWRHKRLYMQNPKVFQKFISNKKDEFNCKEKFLDQQISDIDNLLLRLVSINEKRSNSIVVSSILIYIFLGLTIIFGVVVLIVL